MPKFNHTKGELVRSHQTQRDIQDSDATLTAAQQAKTAEELRRALERQNENDK